MMYLADLSISSKPQTVLFALLTASCGGSSPQELDNQPGDLAAEVRVYAGDEQSALVGTELAVPPAVEVIDANGNGVEGATVTFSILSGGGSVDQETQTTSADGIASAGGWTLGVTPGEHSLTANAGTLTGSPVTFAATAVRFEGISAGWGHTCALLTTGAPHCWGFNNLGALGDGSRADRLTPSLVDGGHTLESMNVGSHTCGIAEAGAAYCWGSNSHGQLGDGTSVDRLSPAAVEAEQSFASVVAGTSHTCGLTDGGAAFCWGINTYGQLGDGTVTTRFVPTPVAGDLIFRKLAAGPAHTCGLSLENDLYCWGNNHDGQLGDGTTEDSSIPVEIALPEEWRDLTTGKVQTCAVTTGGAAYCWGAGAGGALGNGSTEGSVVPIAVVGDETFQLLAAGYFFTCGLTTDGEILCWGHNSDGQLGDGSNEDRFTPGPIAGDHPPFEHLSAGHAHACGITMEGKAICWGWNRYGQLGDASSTNRIDPVAVLWNSHEGM